MSRWLLPFLLLAVAPAALGQPLPEGIDRSLLKPRPSPGAAMIWSLFPGGGHLYLGETTAGLGYTVGTGSLIAAGFEVERRNDALRIQELNSSWMIGEKVYALSFFTTYRSVQEARGRDLGLLGMDDTPLSQLALAPFQWAQLRSPDVWGAGLAGALGAAVAARDARHSLDEVESVGILGQEVDRDEGTQLFALSSFSLSLGASVSEEAVFRGWLQPALQRHWGPNLGLWSSAFAFGLTHIVAPDGRINPTGAAFATLAGAHFGRLYNVSGNRLARPIAAHFWYNFMLLTVGWALNPEGNPLGVEMRFDL